MPISSNASAVDKKRTFKLVNKVLTPSGSSNTLKKPQIPPQTIPPNLASSEPNHDASVVTLQTKSDGTICVLRIDKDTKIDRLNLDRCSLNKIPIVVDDHNHLRLFSLQHNTINNLTINQVFGNLVFLDVYDNEIERIDPISTANQLRVLLIGKNRLRTISGLAKLDKLEVLDLHGNQIALVSGLSGLGKLKVLNLAGNRINSIADGELTGLSSLCELNLRRNGLKKVSGFDDVVTLQKLFLSNNDIRRIDDMITIVKCVQLKELTMDSNPVSVTSDCVSFLVAQLTCLTLVNGVHVTDNFRKTALVWKRNKLQAIKSAPLNGGREKVISNAKTNWELLRTQTKSLTAKHTPNLKHTRPLTSTNVPTPAQSQPRPLHTVPRAHSLDTTDSSSLSNAATEQQQHACYLPPIVPYHPKAHPKSDDDDASTVSSNGPHIDIDSWAGSDDNSDSGGGGGECNIDNITSPVTVDVDVVPLATDGATVVVRSSSDGTGSELSQTNSSIKGRRSVRSAFITRGRLGRRPMQSRAASVKLSKSGSPSTSSTGSSAITAATSTSNITYQGATVLPGASATAANVVGGAVARDREQGGDYLVEICGRHLNVYGQGALRHLDRAWSPARATDVTHVNFHYANYNGIAAVLPRLKHRFPNTSHLTFTGNNLTHLAQLNALAELQGLHAITVHADGNPLVGNAAWRPYAIYRLRHWGLKSINGQEITVAEDTAASAEFGSLGDLVLYTLPGAVLEPLLVHLKLDTDRFVSEGFSKRALLMADAGLRSVITKEALQWRRTLNTQEEFVAKQRAKVRISAIIEEMVHSEMKLRELDDIWLVVLKDIIRNSLLDYTQFDAYKKAKLQEL